MSHPNLFDLHQKMLRRDRATDHGMFLQRLAQDELLERLQDINRRFTKPAIVTGFPHLWEGIFENATIVPDSETLALPAGHFDLVIHAMALHCCNDPIGQVIQSKNALQPDGLFMAASFGGQTLTQLRSALSTAETQIMGGLSPRISPMGEIRDLGAILQRAGLAMPVADNLEIPVSHASLTDLVKDLRAMGETNIMAARLKTFAKQDLFARTEEILKTHFADDAGRIVSTFDLIFLSGWAPHASQPKPLRPGSATTSLLSALEAVKSETKD